jgi:hypothetical protein
MVNPAPAIGASAAAALPSGLEPGDPIAPVCPSFDEAAPSDPLQPPRWMAPDGSKPLTFAEWQAQQPPPVPLSVEQVYPLDASASATGPLIYVMVNRALYSSTSASLARWAADVESEGWQVVIKRSSFPDPAALRSYFAGIPNLAGVLLIGDFPVPWYEVGEQFPIDLYYMDLNGIWQDSDLNGVYDTHTGDIAPEIWIGRLSGSTFGLGGTEGALMNDYFAKNHAYRTGALKLPRRALMYIDDDWAGAADPWSQELRVAYPDTTVVADTEQTTAADYRTRLDDGYELIQIHSHSYSGGHAFKSSQGVDWIFSSEIYDLDPRAFFYNLYAC